MRKSTIFISAVLTTFALVMIYNIASAYHNNGGVTEAPATSVEAAAPSVPEVTSTPAPTKISFSAVQAAQLAAQVVGNNNLLSAESSNINGVDAYKITFTNNDVVYVGLDGQILSIQIAPAVVNSVITLPQTQQNSHSSHTSSQNHTNSESHEEHED